MQRSLQFFQKKCTRMKGFGSMIVIVTGIRGGFKRCLCRNCKYSGVYKHAIHCICAKQVNGCCSFTSPLPFNTLIYQSYYLHIILYESVQQPAFLQVALTFIQRSASKSHAVLFFCILNVHMKLFI